MTLFKWFSWRVPNTKGNSYCWRCVCCVFGLRFYASKQCAKSIKNRQPHAQVVLADVNVLRSNYAVPCSTCAVCTVSRCSAAVLCITLPMAFSFCLLCGDKKVVSIIIIITQFVGEQGMATAEMIMMTLLCFLRC